MSGPVPCTPVGIEAILSFYEIPVAGKEVVIVGRGNTIGRPLASAALAEAAHCQRRRHPGAHRGEGLGALRGPGRHRDRRRRRAWHDPPRTPHSRCHRGGRGGALRGTQAAARRRRGVRRVAGAITPRVGGVGPTTIAMLFRNFVEAAERSGGRWRMTGPSRPRPKPPVPPRARSAGPVGRAPSVCPDCGMTLLGVDGRPGPFSRRTLWWWAGALADDLSDVVVIVALAVRRLSRPADAVCWRGAHRPDPGCPTGWGPSRRCAVASLAVLRVAPGKRRCRATCTPSSTPSPTRPRRSPHAPSCR